MGLHTQGQAGGKEGALPPTAGFSGGGATAFPAETAGKTLPGEHLSDFTKKVIMVPSALTN